jgi:transcriptional regulator with PAS, ATPase and Fis domain
MRALKTLLQRVAASPASTVLLRGESGTGKDLAAKTIHYNSDRSPKPFMNITCSALPDALLESELFGHERGAFTDARERKQGLFEHADKGTVFLDEIGEMPPVMQAKLLRFLEEKTFRRVGGTVDIRADVRIIAATNTALKEAAKRGAFREDLYFRLAVLALEMPPLRQRTGDLELLAEHFITRFNREFDKRVLGVEREALAELSRYPWPGNVRELRNVFERAVLLAEGPMLDKADFLVLGSGERTSWSPTYQLPANGVDFAELERSLVKQALRRANGNRTLAGSLLGMNRDQIRYRIEKFGLAQDVHTEIVSVELNRAPVSARSRN